MGRDRLEAALEERGGAAAQAGDDERGGEAPPGTTADADEPADLTRRERELAERPTISAVGDAPGLRQADEIGPAVVRAPRQDGATGKAPIAKEHRGEASGTGIGQQHMQLIKEGKLEAGNLITHGTVLVAVPQQWDTTTATGQHRLEDAELATRGGIHNDGDVLAVTGPPRERGLGECPAQGPAVEAFVPDPAPQLLIRLLSVWV